MMNRRVIAAGSLILIAVLLGFIQFYYEREGAFKTSSLATAATGSAPAKGVDFVCASFNYTPAQIEFIAQQLEAAGVTSVRLQNFTWHEMEPQPGQYNPYWLTRLDYCVKTLRKHNIKISGEVLTTPNWAANPGGIDHDNCPNNPPYTCPPEDPQTFGNFMSFLANRYKADVSAGGIGRVDAWEIWNEVNHPRFWPIGNNTVYLNLLKAVYPKIKAVDPSIQVVMGGPAGPGLAWVSDMYNLGVKNYIDAVALHPYSGFDVVDDVYNVMVAKGDGGKPIWYTEWGTGRGQGAWAQADYLTNGFNYAANNLPYVKVAQWFISDSIWDCIASGDSKFCDYSLLGNAATPADLTPNPAYCALKLYPAAAPHDTQAPNVPGNLRLVNSTASSISLAWNAPTDSGGCGMDGYKIFRDGKFLTNTVFTSFTDTGLTLGKTYTYNIQAYDNAGNTSGPATITVTTTTNKSPIGFLDSIDSTGLARGWALDPDTPSQSIDVHFYIDGPAGSGIFAGARKANWPRPDVNQKTGYPGDHGFEFVIPNLFRDGKPHTLYVYGIDSTGGGNPQLSKSPQNFSVAGLTGDAQISSLVNNSLLVIKTSSRVAGTIDSLTWRNKEFINKYDHGRELQSAAQFDGYGECYNPTEGGSSADGTRPVSTSILRSLSASGNVLTAKTQMAFWLRSGETSPFCPAGAVAQNKHELSDYFLDKKVTIGFQGIPNVIEHLVTFTVPNQHNSAFFEALTGYMPSEFSSFWTYDPKTQKLNPLSDGPGEQNLPVILATPDGQYAMGVYSPDLPDPKYPWAGYGRFRFNLPGPPENSTVKWNCVFRRSPVPAGSYNFRCYSIVGTLQQVTSGMDKLYQYYYKDTTPPRVLAINRVTPSPTTAPSVQYSVTFSEPVTGVDSGDFTLAGSGLSGTAISGITGSGASYTVTVNTGSGTGWLQLYLVDNDSIKDAAQNPLAGPGTGNGNFTGQVYVIDRTPPLVSLTSPVNGATVAGLISVTANALDNQGVAGVQFKLDGSNLGTEDTASPYAVSWDTSQTANGLHTLTAIARDAAGNTKTSNPVTVKVNNQAGDKPPVVTIIDPETGSYVKGQITISAKATDDVGVAGVQFKINGQNLGAEVGGAGPIYSIIWDTTKVASQKDGYKITAIARDSAGQKTAAAEKIITVDNDKPSIAITKPANGEKVKDIYKIKAAVADNIGLAGVQFKLDEQLLGAELIQPPYEYDWITANFAAGPHTLTAVARDIAGNSQTSPNIQVIVDQQQSCSDTAAPTIPTDLRVVNKTTNTIHLAWKASTDIGCAGLAGYKIYRNDNLLATTKLTAFTDTNLKADTTYHYRVAAYDNVNNTSAASAQLTVTTNASSGEGGGGGGESGGAGGGGGGGSGMTVEQLKARIAELQTLVQSLILKLQAILVSQGQTSSIPFPTRAFDSDLGYGDRRAEVRYLQGFLISRGFLNPGLATGNYGPLTVAAVKAYQTAKGIIPQSGYFGPKTREAVNRELGF